MDKNPKKQNQLQKPCIKITVYINIKFEYIYIRIAYKIQRMSKRSQKQIPLTVNKQKQIINKIQQHYQQNTHFTLFQKLQYYDHVIGEAQVSRIDQWVLNVFRKIMEDQGKVTGRVGGGFGSLGGDVDGIQRRKQLAKQYSVNAYSSPNNKKANDDIEDPQLFSFSKTRKESSTNQQKGTILTMLSRQNLQKLNKNKQHSDKPRYSAIPVLQSEPNERKVSEFNSQYITNTENGVTGEISSKRSQNFMERDRDMSVYQLAKAVKVRVVGDKFREFVGLLRDNVRMRRKGFKMRTSVYVHQLKLMKKTISGFKLFNQQAKHKIGAFINNKNRQKTSQIFYQWLTYATRPQQQRIRQTQIKQKQTLLKKTLGLHKFLSNSQYLHTNLQQPITIPFSAYLAQYKQQLKQKQNKLQRILALKCMCRRYETKQQIKDKIDQLKMRRKGSEFRIFIRLMMCFLEILKRRDDKLCGVVERKNGAMQFIVRVRRQYFFQKAYWNESKKDERLSLSQVDQINNKVSSYKFLDQKYKKILFIYQILDCIYHSLHRKGYNPINLFSPSFMPSQTSLSNMNLSILFQSHPSYRKFYLPYKLHKYFSALKDELITKKNQRMNKIKYQICGRRVLQGGLLVWYKGELQRQLCNKKIQQKSMILNALMREKRVQEVVKVMGKSANFQQAEEELNRMLIANRICRAIMILKTYTISKNYYRKAILGSKLKTKYRTLEAYFLEWKLFYSESMHSRITMTSLQKIIKKSAIRRLSQNIEQYSLPDRLHHKKCENLLKSQKSNNGQIFLSLLKRSWQIRKNGGRGNKKTIQQKLVKVNQIIQIGLKKKVLAELVEKWYQKKLCNQICVMVDGEYQRKLVFKCFVGMKVMVKFEREERDKAGVIRKNVEDRVKRRVLGSFIDKLIQKLYLRRTTIIAKKYWFEQLKNKLQQLSSDLETHELSP